MRAHWKEQRGLRVASLLLAAAGAVGHLTAQAQSRPRPAAPRVQDHAEHKTHWRATRLAAPTPGGSILSTRGRPAVSPPSAASALAPVPARRSAGTAQRLSDPRAGATAGSDAGLAPPRSTTRVVATAAGGRKIVRERVRTQVVGSPGETTDEGAGAGDWFDPLLVETFAGPSYLLMMLGHSLPTDAAGIAAAAPTIDPNRARAGDFVDAVRASGRNMGIAASMRLAFLSLGARFSYARYDRITITTVTGARRGWWQAGRALPASTASAWLQT